MEGWTYSIPKLLLPYLNLTSFYSLFYFFFSYIFIFWYRFKIGMKNMVKWRKVKRGRRMLDHTCHCTSNTDMKASHNININDSASQIMPLDLSWDDKSCRARSNQIRASQVMWEKERVEGEIMGSGKRGKKWENVRLWNRRETDWWEGRQISSSLCHCHFDCYSIDLITGNHCSYFCLYYYFYFDSCSYFRF